MQRLGDTKAAARHYVRALGYWRSADAELAALVREAQAGLGRVGKPE